MRRGLKPTDWTVTSVAHGQRKLAALFRYYLGARTAARVLLWALAAALPANVILAWQVCEKIFK